MSLTKEQEFAITKVFAHKYIDYLLDPSYYRSGYSRFSELPQISPVVPLYYSIDTKFGDVITGSYGNGFYITIRSKVGDVTLYNVTESGPVHWACSQEYSLCQSAKDAGFGETSGQIQSIKQLEHIFFIADSYK